MKRMMCWVGVAILGISLTARALTNPCDTTGQFNNTGSTSLSIVGGGAWSNYLRAASQTGNATVVWEVAVSVTTASTFSLDVRSDPGYPDLADYSVAVLIDGTYYWLQSTITLSNSWTHYSYHFPVSGQLTGININIPTIWRVAHYDNLTVAGEPVLMPRAVLNPCETTTGMNNTGTTVLSINNGVSWGKYLQAVSQTYNATVNWIVNVPVTTGSTFSLDVRSDPAYSAFADYSVAVLIDGTYYWLQSATTLTKSWTHYTYSFPVAGQLTGININIPSSGQSAQYDNLLISPEWVPIPLQNPSFEQPAVSGWTAISPGNLPGWLGNWSALALLTGGSHGLQQAYLSDGYLYQTLAAKGQPNRSYSLKVDGLGNLANDRLYMEFQCNNQGYGQYQQLSTAGWTTANFTLTLPANVPANSDLTFVLQAEPANGTDLYIDNVRLTGDLEPFEYLWFDNLNSHTDPGSIVSASAYECQLYNDEYCDTNDPAQVQRVQTYLDNANNRGVKVILDACHILRQIRDGIKTWTHFTNYVKLFKDHPALKGWYLADEPTDAEPVSLTLCQSASAIIRQNSTKPIYMAFDKADIDNNAPYNYRNTYDIMLYDRYPFEDDYSEFEGLEDEWFLNLWVTKPGWKSRCEDAMDQANAAGRPFMNIIQAFGYIPGTISKRLPTYTEERFICYWSIMKGAKGLAFWMDDFLSWSTANSGHPYPYDGDTWRTQVGAPVGQELNQLKDALKAGPIANSVSRNNSNILCTIYRDPWSGQYHLLAVNDSDGSSNVTFTLNLPVPIVFAQVLYGSGSHPNRTVTNNAFTDTLTPYEVHHYLLNIP